MRLGLALGGGAARGWAHFGVLDVLAEEGLYPDVICGTSIGAVVGSAYASGQLDVLRTWALQMGRWEVVRLLDWTSGGISGERLMQALQQRVPEQPIEQLQHPFGCVATDLASGREIWLTQGSLSNAIRASIALPGLFTPLEYQGRWLVDGGLVDPVPVTLCRALGAERVIAVSLNHAVLERLTQRRERREQRRENLRQYLRQGLRLPIDSGNDAPHLFDTLAGAIYLMQDRITRSRLAGDPPDILLAPRLGHIGLMDFHRASEAIEAGRESADALRPQLKALARELAL